MQLDTIEEHCGNNPLLLQSFVQKEESQAISHIDLEFIEENLHFKDSEVALIFVNIKKFMNCRRFFGFAAMKTKLSKHEEIK